MHRVMMSYKHHVAFRASAAECTNSWHHSTWSTNSAESLLVIFILMGTFPLHPTRNMCPVMFPVRRAGRY